jgi:hypothetical protein
MASAAAAGTGGPALALLALLTSACGSAPPALVEAPPPGSVPAPARPPSGEAAVPRPPPAVRASEAPAAAGRMAESALTAARHGDAPPPAADSAVTRPPAVRPPSPADPSPAGPPVREATQIRPGDTVAALAAQHGFDPLPAPIPPETRFARLRLGMTKQDAEALLGRPDASLHHANEGARIPFYASDDSSRWETFYRGQGRLTFSGAWLTGEVRLIRIEYDPTEDGRPRR